MTTIAQIKTWPNDAVIELIQGRVEKVYPAKQTGTGKTVQNADFKDSSGESIRLTVWEHADLAPLEGKEIILSSSKGYNGKTQGVKVVHGSYVAKKDGRNYKAGDTVPTLEISVSKTGQFQLVQVHQGQAAAPVQAGAVRVEKVPDVARAATIHGATVGMAINKVCDSMTAAGVPLDADAIWRQASPIVRLALKMEQGDLYNGPNVPGASKEDVPY